MLRNSSRAAASPTAAITVLALVGFAWPVGAQKPNGSPPAEPPARPLGGRVDPGGANNRNVAPQGGGVRIGSDGANNPQLRILSGRVQAENGAPPQRLLPPPAEPTSELLVFLQPGTDPARFARDHAVQMLYRLRSDPNAWVVRAATPRHALAVNMAMANDRRLRAAYPNRRVPLKPFSFTPNDPYFHRNTPAAGWPGQWHLINEFTPGLDARVKGAWDRNITGNGVVIGFIEDGIETTHPDLAPNYVAADSWDFVDNDPIPDPDSFIWYDYHGTAVAGVAAARGGNGIGLTGAAPFAGIAGLRYGDTDAQVVDATLYHSSGANTHIKVKNHSYGSIEPYAPRPADRDALAVSTAAGTIHTFAAGNGRGGEMGETLVEDANMLEPQNSPDAITVAAMSSSGLFATYSNWGANVFVTAPSGSGSRVLDQWPYFELDITTTDRSGDAGFNWGTGGRPDSFPDAAYTSIFGGTSAAAPVIAGVMAMGKQVQPNLNTRFAKHLLALTSDVIDPNDKTLSGDGDGVTPGSAWRKNAAGYLFNQNYGMGLINADAFTKAATQYSGVTPLQVENTGLLNVGAQLPDNNLTGIKRTFTINSTTPLEEVLLTLNVTHPWHGDVDAWLTSPSGTRARVMQSFDASWDPYDREHNIHWTFCVNTFWGENPRGVWTLQVRDVRPGNVGTFDSFAVTARMGQLVSGGTNNATTSITVPNVTGAIGQTVPLTATLRRTSDNAVLYGGTLTYRVNGAVVGTAVTNNNGVATLNYKAPDTLGLGNKTLTVDYGGNTTYGPSTGNATLAIVKANTSVTVPTLAALNGQAITLSATLRRATDNVVLYGGTLSFSVDGIVVGTAVTNGSGVASLAYTVPAAMSLGNHTIRASFAGTGFYNASAGTATLQVKANTTLTMASVTGKRGSAVALSATLRRASNGALLSGGTITFKVDGVVVGAAATDATGVARLAYTIPTTKTAGAHPMAASYGGNAYYNASTAAATLTAQ